MDVHTYTIHPRELQVLVVRANLCPQDGIYP